MRPELDESAKNLSPCQILDSLELYTGRNGLFQLFLGCFWGQMVIFSKLTPYYEAITEKVIQKSISFSNLGLIGTLHWLQWPILAVFRVFLGSNGHFFNIDPLL